MVERSLGDAEKAFFITTIAAQMKSPEFKGGHFRSTYQSGEKQVVLTMPSPGMDHKETDIYSAVISTPSSLPDRHTVVTEQSLEFDGEIFSYREMNNVYDADNGLVPERSTMDISSDLPKGYNDVMSIITSLNPDDEVRG